MEYIKDVIQTSRKKNYLSLAITANELFTCTWLSVKASTPIVKPTPTSILVTPNPGILTIVFIVADPSLLADVLVHCWKPR